MVRSSKFFFLFLTFLLFFPLAFCSKLCVRALSLSSRSCSERVRFLSAVLAVCSRSLLSCGSKLRAASSSSPSPCIGITQPPSHIRKHEGKVATTSSIAPTLAKGSHPILASCEVHARIRRRSLGREFLGERSTHCRCDRCCVRLGAFKSTSCCDLRLSACRARAVSKRVSGRLSTRRVALIRSRQDLERCKWRSCCALSCSCLIGQHS